MSTSSHIGAWDRTKKRDAIARALGIVKRRVQYGFSTSVNKEEYEGLIFDPLRKAGFKSTDGAHTAYSFCLANCLKQLSSWADHHSYTELVSYFFESGAGVGNDINSLMANIKTDRELRQRFRYHVWSFKDKQDTPQLQAADMNAYESHKHWVNTLHSKRRRLPRYTFESLMEIPQKGDYLGKEDIVGIIKQTCVYVPPGVELPPGARGVIVKP